MEIVLKRIKAGSFDDVIDTVLSKYREYNVIGIDAEELEQNSENVVVYGKTISVNYDVDKYTQIVAGEELTYKRLAMIGMQLHKDTKGINGEIIPTNILYEKEVWAYISLKVFGDIIKQLRLDDDDKITEDKIKRFYFNTGEKTRSGLSRTGLLFVWSMIDLLESEGNEQMSTVAFHFVDPVKAVYERAISKNPIILRAFVQAIINCKCDPRIKNKEYKTKIPKNINCFARVNILDAYNYDELVNLVTAQIKEILK